MQGVGLADLERSHAIIASHDESAFSPGRFHENVTAAVIAITPTWREPENRPTVLLVPPPALGERRRRSLAHRLIAVRRRAPLEVSDHPHPGPALQSNGHQKDAADDNAVFEHLVVFLV